ncbi:unnamed protein product [Cochlearia groenlandica]
MTNFTILVTMILFFTCVTSQDTSRDFESSKLQWRHHPRHFFPRPLHRGKALSPAPASDNHHFHPSPVVTKCLSDCRDVKTCFDDIAKAFFTRKAAIGSECCASIQKMNEDCEKTIFGSFHNPFFNGYVKLHCSTKAIASAPSPA